MKTATITLVLALAVIGTGCNTTENSSRNLADPSVPGKTLALQVCSNCHGVTGNSVNPTFPRLAGQREWYLIAQLKGFKSHNRANSEGFGSEYMWGLSRNLTDAQIKEMAVYFAQQKPVVGKPENTKLEHDGKAIFANGLSGQSVQACATCHGAEGAGNEGSPRIAGQHGDYITKQLLVFQRTNERPDGAVMKVVAHNLTPEDIKAVAAYVSTIASK